MLHDDRDATKALIEPTYALKVPLTLRMQVEFRVSGPDPLSADDVERIRRAFDTFVSTIPVRQLTER